MGRLIVGILLGLVMAPLLVVAWFKWGNPPVAVTDKALPYEKQMVSVPLHARIDREMVQTPPDHAGRGKPGGRRADLSR